MELRITITLAMFITLTASKTSIKDKCKNCREFIANFEKGMQRTARDNFGGGDVAWQEKNLGSFQKSETRLLEILDDPKEICKDATTEGYCHSMIEQYEEDIENWWFNKHGPVPEFEEILCIDTVKVCCPSGTYGSDCKDCPTGEGNPGERTFCNSHGQCNGNGTRGGSGKCKCDEGYNGTLCDTCNEGYLLSPDKNCEDRNECLSEEADCSDDEYCLNTNGSFECKDCHKACDACKNESITSCTACKEGYRLNSEVGGCEDIDECEEQTDACVEPLVCHNKNGSFSCAKPGPAGYTPGVNNFHYKLHNSESNWTTAMQACVSEGAKIVPITTKEIHEDVKKLFPSPRFWIGLTDVMKEGEWSTFPGGVATNLSFWETGEPNGARKANCVVTNWDSPGKWNDDSCDSHYPFLCQATSLGEKSAETEGSETEASDSTDQFQEKLDNMKKSFEEELPVDNRWSKGDAELDQLKKSLDDTHSEL